MFYFTCNWWCKVCKRSD